MKKSIRGFTIVELLIVIVVIAILAAITIVAYNGIQVRARDSARDSALNSLKKSIELYNAQNGSYPAPSSCISMGCTVSNLSTYLVPTFTNTVPDDPSAPTKHIYYVTNPTYTGYGLYVQNYEGKTPCKYISPNGTAGWWDGVPIC